MQYIAPYVLRSEYACRCCGRVPPEVKGDYMELPIFYWQLFDFFGSLRRAWDKPITISSGYRCPKHNQEIGGNFVVFFQETVHLPLGRGGNRAG